MHKLEYLYVCIIVTYMVCKTMFAVLRASVLLWVKALRMGKHFARYVQKMANASC